MERFESMAGVLDSESKLLGAARDALSLDPMDGDTLAPIQAEMADLREVRSRTCYSIAEQSLVSGMGKI